MSAKRISGASVWVDPDDAPELTEEFFNRAEVRQGDDLIRRGRPKAAHTKTLVSMRLDPDLIARLKADGPGWQSRANDLLRQAVGL